MEKTHEKLDVLLYSVVLAFGCFEKLFRHKNNPADARLFYLMKREDDESYKFPHFLKHTYSNFLL